MSEERGHDLHTERGDHYDQGIPAKKSAMKGIVTVFFGAAVLIGGLGGAGYWFYNQGQPSQDEGDLPILLPDPSPIKIRPEDPGGMEVPHRETTVYDQLSDIDPDQNVVLQELPDMPRVPEVTATPSSGENTLSEAAASETMVADNGEGSREQQSSTIDEENAGSQSAIAAPAIDEPEPLSDAQKAIAAAENRSAPESPATTQAPPSSSPIGSYRIQLASVRDENAPAAEWKRLSSKHKQLLGSLEMFVERADLGDNGVYYRLQAGPLASDGAATQLCEQLKQLNVGCIVVRP
ncbi:SPOR domain-containing protein [Thalassospira sp. MA62]|nr:SPOR domain-containing protein [Thalassospira sp. MA62]